MCGIFGQYNPHGTDRALIERMAICLAHRGPDGYGIYSSTPLTFGAGRLAIIDVPAAAGPIFNEDRQVGVVFNGEIYNYRALREELQKLGHYFTTATDTEVLVHGYEQWGVDVLDRLRGMFAFGIWDAANERLFLARDRLGEKPLYYTRAGDDFLFASEIKALFEHPGVKREVNADVLPYYLALGYVPPPQTMFAGIEKLAPGERLILDRHNCTQERYWQAQMDTTAPLSYAESVRRVRDAVTEAVETRLVSDVPVGAFLSGGLDSTAVVALMKQIMKHPPQTFTVGFDFDVDSKGDSKFNVDARFAALAAERLGTEHHVITINQTTHLSELLPHLIYALDEPVAQPSIIQTAYVAALARRNGVPVLLSGDAGDELFAGYTSYRADRVLERYLRVPKLLRQTVLNPILERIPQGQSLAAKSHITDPVDRYLTWMRLIGPDRLPGLMIDQRLASGAHQTISRVVRPLLDAPCTNHFADRVAFASLNLWIAEDSNMRVDKMSMAMSIEARAPLEDHKLVELAMRIPLEHKLRQGDFKRVFKDAVADWVPAEILRRPKWGFVPPTSDWLRTVLKPLVETYLSPENVEAVGWFKPEAITGLIDDHMTKRNYELWSLWPLLVFHIWHALYIDGSLKLDHKLTPLDLF